jgi:hypothetical protein
MNRSRKKILLENFLNAPLNIWVLLGFSVTYILFYVGPIFFSEHVMQFFKYLPAFDPIGVDLKQMLSYSQSWLVAKQTPYIGNNIYPPLASVLFSPLLMAGFPWVYKMVTIVNIFCFGMITLVLPRWIVKERQISSILMLVFITGLFSYGFQFELERGQFNVIAIFLCYLAIWIYHHHNKYRYIAFILFTISVQLKIYPLIFIVMLINDWQDWRNNLKRLLVLSAVNIALFFVLGLQVFDDFVKALITQTYNPYIWNGNHSIRSFVAFLPKIANDQGWSWINQYLGLVEPTLMAITVGCIFLIIWQTFRQKQKGINPFLLLGCTFGALIIPSVSNDYKLSILAAPIAILFINNKFLYHTENRSLRMTYNLLILFFSAAYASTLLSYTNKPLILKNNFPAIVSMLLVITFLSLVSKPAFTEKGTESIETT